MPNFNKVMLMGNLTRDPEIKYTKGDRAVVNFTIAVNRMWTDRSSGEKKKETAFVPVVVWGAAAENCSKFLQKGSPVFVEGRLVSNSWDTPSGEKRSRLEVNASTVQFLTRAPSVGSVPRDEEAVDEVAEEPPAGSEEDVPF